ncbi:MAG: hypothetical protein ACK4TF_08090 [Thermodesulfovibrionales bacterium]
MLIWTTHELRDLLVEGDLQLKIEHPSNIKEAMLRDAGISDCGLIPLDENYKEFLAKLRAKGVTGPVIFIAENTPRVPEEFLYPRNALCFSLQEDDIIKMGMFINFIFRLAQLRAIPDLKPDHQVSFREGVIDKPVEEPLKIKEEVI